MKFIKDNLYIFVGAVLFSVLLFVLYNAIMEGYTVMVTQDRIDDSYKIHK